MKRIALFTVVALSLGFSPAYADSEEASAIRDSINQDQSLTRDISWKLTQVEQLLASTPQDSPFYNDYLIARQNTKNDMNYVSQRIQSNTERLAEQLAKDAIPQSPIQDPTPSPEPSPSPLEIAQPQQSQEPVQVVSQEPSSLPTPELIVVSVANTNSTIETVVEKAVITEIPIQETSTAVVEELLVVAPKEVLLTTTASLVVSSKAIVKNKKKVTKRSKKKVLQ